MLHRLTCAAVAPVLPWNSATGTVIGASAVPIARAVRTTLSFQRCSRFGMGVFQSQQRGLNMSGLTLSD